MRPPPCFGCTPPPFSTLLSTHFSTRVNKHVTSTLTHALLVLGTAWGVGVAREQLQGEGVWRAVACVVKERDLVHDGECVGRVDLESGDVSAYMMLDGGALSVLHILPSGGGSGSGGGGGRAVTPVMASDTTRAIDSVFGVLNRGKTAMGTRTLVRWLRQPLLDVTAIRLRQQMVALLVGDAILRNELLHECFKVRVWVRS